MSDRVCLCLFLPRQFIECILCFGFSNFCSVSCIGHRFVFNFLLTKCSLLTKYLYSPQLIYFNSHTLSIPLFLSFSSLSATLSSSPLPSKWIFIAAFRIKVLPVRLTPPPSKMNTDLCVSSRKTEGVEGVR